MKDDEYNYEDIGYLWDKRAGNKKTIACFFSLFLSCFGRSGWTATLTRQRPLGRTPLGRSIWRPVLFCCVYAVMFFFFPFLLNLYIEAGLVYRTLSLQKDRVGNPGQKGQESRTFPRNCPNGGRMSLLQSPSLFCLIFLRLLLSDEEQLKLESLRSLTADELCAGWPEVLQDNPKASTPRGDLSRFKGEHSHKRHKTEKDCI